VRPGDRRLLVAVAASASAHAALLAALSGRLGEQPEPASSRGDALEVALVPRRPAPLPPSLPDASGSSFGPAGPAPTPPRRLRPSTEPVGGAGSPGRGPAAEAARASPPAAPGAPGTREWLEAEGISPGQPPSAPFEIGPLRLGPAPAGGAGEARGAETRAEAAMRAERRLDQLFGDQLAADRAEMGADPYFTALGERLERDLQVDWAVLGRGPAEEALGSAGHVLHALAAWQRRAERWARGEEAGGGGGPPLEERDDMGKPRALGPGTGDDLLATELVTRIEIEQGGDGSIVAVRLVGGSGNADHDRLVLARVEALASGRLGPPPAQGRRTRWAVSTRFEVVPPLPVAGCGFDATFHPAGCAYPLQRRVKSSARLERIYAGE